ncbi:MAG: hypothetical protein GWN87_25455, partial [Desulfuromonadales bacterium]|nr:hypothetical protein [Desulfuromonadales bacterium]
QASHKLAEKIYAQSQEGQEGGAEAAGQTAGEKDEDVVDAEYEEVDEEDK